MPPAVPLRTKLSYPNASTRWRSDGAPTRQSLASAASAGGETGAPGPGPAWRRDPAASLGRLSGARKSPSSPGDRTQASRSECPGRRRSQVLPGGSRAGELQWRCLYLGEGAPRRCGFLRGMGLILVPRRGLGGPGLPWHPGVGVAVSDSMQSKERTSDLSLSVGLRAGVPRSKASFGQRGGPPCPSPPASHRRRGGNTPRGLQEKGGRNRPHPARAGRPDDGGAAVFAAGPGRGATPSPSARSPSLLTEGRPLTFLERRCREARVKAFASERTKKRNDNS